MELTPLALWLNTVFAGADEAVAVAIHRLYTSAGWFFTPFSNLMSLLGKWGLVLIFTAFVLMYFRRTRRMGTAMLIALAAGLVITNFLAKPLAARPRPYSWEGSVFQQIWMELGCHTEKDFSFPSGHMNAAMAVSTAVFCTGNKKRSWMAFFFAIAMGLARIYLGLHYFSDVLGAVVTGGIGGLLGWTLSGIIPSVYYEVEDLRTLIPGSARKGKHER